MSDRDADADAPNRADLAGVWDQFYDYCFAVIHQCPGVRRLSQADREDCVQDVMVEVVRRFGERHPEDLRDELTGWIRVLSRNKAADIARRRTRKPEVRFDDGAGAAVLDGSPRAPDADRQQAEYVGLVWESLLALEPEVSPTSYIAFYLRNIEGWDVGDIAELFEMTPDLVRVRCHRVKEKLGPLVRGRGDLGEPGAA